MDMYYRMFRERTGTISFMSFKFTIKPSLTLPLLHSANKKNNFWHLEGEYYNKIAQESISCLKQKINEMLY